MNGTNGTQGLQLSVVVPTYNRLERLRRVLTALERQTLSRDLFEVIVVSDGCTDGTATFLAQIETGLQLNPLLQENSGVAVARNNGVAAARAELILFVDDDVVPAPDLLEVHLDLHRQHANLIVLGPMLTPAGYEMSPWVRWEQTMLYRQYQALEEGRYPPTGRQFYTGNTSLPQAAILAAGGFDPAFNRAEDIELGFRLDRLKLNYLFCMAAKAEHYAERTFQAWIDIAYAYGRNAVIFTRDRQVEWCLPATLAEYQNRNALVHLLSRACLDRERASRLVTNLLRSVATWSNRLGRHRLTLAACSGMYNLRYYQGVADELGGRAEFFRRVRQANR